jgi:hypothetical protein
MSLIILIVSNVYEDPEAEYTASIGLRTLKVNTIAERSHMSHVSHFKT